MHITQQLMIQLKAEMYREIKHKIYILKEIFTAGGGGGRDLRFLTALVPANSTEQPPIFEPRGTSEQERCMYHRCLFMSS